MLQADEYQVQVALQSANFDDALINETLESTSLDVAGLEVDTHYQWRVRALAGGGSSDWSEVWTFRTNMGILPGPVTLSMSANRRPAVMTAAPGRTPSMSSPGPFGMPPSIAELGQWDAENPLQIWVAAGTYLPHYRADFIQGDPIDHPDTAFVLIENVQIYGGFAGTESSLAQRDWRKMKPF
jgi:hypothetical protein